MNVNGEKHGGFVYAFFDALTSHFLSFSFFLFFLSQSTINKITYHSVTKSSWAHDLRSSVFGLFILFHSFPPPFPLLPFCLFFFFPFPPFNPSLFPNFHFHFHFIFHFWGSGGRFNELRAKPPPYLKKKGEERGEYKVREGKFERGGAG